jgi:acetyl-CoA synthetase
MSSLLDRFVSRTDFESYEDFKENFKITVPENFNFAFDVVDVYAKDDPDKLALVWCNDLGEEKITTFGEMKRESDKAANFFSGRGIKKGDAVMLSLKSRREFWISMIGLHKIGAVAIPATHMLKKKDILYRIRRADLKMIVTIEEEGVPEEVDGACEELGNGTVLKAFVGNEEREGWLNFRAELDAASPNFERPSGDGATKN